MAGADAEGPGGTGIGTGVCFGGGIFGIGTGVCFVGTVGIGTGVCFVGGLFPCARAAAGVAFFIIGEACELDLGGWGGRIFVSFLAGTPAGFAAGGGRGEFLGSRAFGTVLGLGTGTGVTSGETVRSNPMLGNGATGLLSCFTGRL